MPGLNKKTRAKYVMRMFSRISGRYDLLNTIMSAGRHYAWRKRAIKIIDSQADGNALDIATGTGDFAIELASHPKTTYVVGIDFASRMIPIAQDKTRVQNQTKIIEYLVGDAHSLPFKDDSFLFVTIGFGVRNFMDLNLALKEIYRVLVDDGKLIVLEIIRADEKHLMTKILNLGFKYITPWLGLLFAQDREAYTYLPESVGGFLSASELCSVIENSGLKVDSYEKLALGTVAIYKCSKNSKNS